MTKKPDTQSDNKLWKPQVWWVPIIVAIVGLIGVVLPFLVTLDPDPPSPSPSQPFTYLVRVQEMGTSHTVSDAKVSLEVSGQAPLDEITDSNGFARIFVNDAYSRQPGRLLIEAAGYEIHRQEIDLTEGDLPDTVRLNSLPPTPTITNSPTSPPPTPTNTSTPTDMPPSIPPTTTPTHTATPTLMPTETNIPLPQPTLPTETANFTPTPLPTLKPVEIINIAQSFPTQKQDIIGQIQSVELHNNKMRWNISFLNKRDTSVEIWFMFKENYLADEQGTRYDVKSNSYGIPNSQLQRDVIEPGVRLDFWMEFDTPQDGSYVFTVGIETNAAGLGGSTFRVTPFEVSLSPR